MNLSPALWPVVQTFGRQGVAYIAFLTLSFVLEPKDFGVLGMAMAWVAFINVFAEVGFGAAIIQKQKIQKGHLNTTFLVNVTLGLILLFVGLGVARIAAWFFKTPEVRPVLAVLSLGFLINALSLTQVAYLQRRMQFKKLALRDLIASTLGAVVAIVLALNGYGVWSLVAQSLTVYTAGSVLIWFYSAWKPGIHDVSFSYLKDLWSFSSRIFLFNIFKYFSQNIDKVLVGYYLDPTALGYYTFAFRIVIFPFTTFVGAVGTYLFPKYSRMQSQTSLIKENLFQVIKILNSVVCPLLILIAFWGHAYVPLIFQGKWTPALEIFPVMAIVAFLQSNISPVGNLMKALNKPDWLLKWSILITGLVGLSMFFGARYGLYGIAVSLLISYFIGIFVIYNIVHKLVHPDWAELMDISKFVLIPVAITCILIIGANMLIDITLMPVFLILIIILAAIFITNFILDRGKY